MPFLIDWLASPHPATNLPVDAVLLALELQHPQPDLLGTVLAELGGDERITVSGGSPALRATVRTPKGDVTL